MISNQAARTHRQSGLQADLLVAGGGLAGVSAAISAARNGLSVVLVQDRSVLGGNSSSEVRMHTCGADMLRDGLDNRESGIIEELRLEEAVRNPQRSPSMWDLILYEAIRREPELTLLLNTYVDGVEMEASGRIRAALATRPSTEERFRIEAPLFVDATGDGRLGVEAGAEYRVGREARHEFGESLAPEAADTKVLGSTLLLMARRHDRPMPFVPPPWIRRFHEEDLPHRPHVDYEYGYWWLEWGGELDTIRDNERIRDELLAIALGIWDHVKNSGLHPDSAPWALEWVGMVPGKRESRRFLGDHVLTQQDVQEAVLFPDRVAYGGWPIDLHPPEGVFSPDPPCVQHGLRQLYSIPLGSLYSRNVPNLFMAGRNISATHVAFASTRVMATCSVIGQAVGAAAARCLEEGLSPRELRNDPAALGRLQQTLLLQDAYLIGVRNEDPLDLARRASVRASSEASDAPAARVLDGVTRRTAEGSHYWQGRPEEEIDEAAARWLQTPRGSSPPERLARPRRLREPQWLELRWAEPVPLREVHLTFDTGLHRRLALSQSDSETALMIRGPQPETVADYVLKGTTADGRVVELARTEENYQRKRVHDLSAAAGTQRFTALRVEVLGTQGFPAARIFEVRVY
ncbi:FAD-dependent oxidoreductase [Limnochorda pilosa]|uniref:Fumarate reductase n=1 Tax=Limnochorda pilosa TaxID=1555112 RepID=A0A0K2SGV8_LIMPI|nr:FAD-dependent oxidoreductase [Limnochorda pilosa]BAS26325.1 hypothetical protein LIP_0468 [Limnochorda pilosa]